MNKFGKLALAFFDVDGTLMRRDFNGVLSLKSRAFNYAAETVFGIRGFDYTKILGKRIFGLTDRTILKTTLSQIGIDEKDYYEKESKIFLAIDEYFNRYMDQEKITGYYALPGIFDFLGALKDNGVRLGLVTGNIRKHAEWKMKICGFENYFTTGGYGEDAESRSGILMAGIHQNPDIKPENICHFGDSPADLMAARDCRIKCVALTDAGGGTHSRTELAEIGYGLLIDSWAEHQNIAAYLAGS